MQQSTTTMASLLNRSDVHGTNTGNERVPTATRSNRPQFDPSLSHSTTPSRPSVSMDRLRRDAAGMLAVVAAEAASPYPNWMSSALSSQQRTSTRNGGVSTIGLSSRSRVDPSLSHSTTPSRPSVPMEQQSIESVNDPLSNGVSPYRNLHPPIEEDENPGVLWTEEELSINYNLIYNMQETPILLQPESSPQAVSPSAIPDKVAAIRSQLSKTGINLRFNQTISGEEKIGTMPVNSGDTFGMIKEFFCEEQGVPPGSLELFFKERKLSDKDTPSSLRMNESDIIDICPIQDDSPPSSSEETDDSLPSRTLFLHQAEIDEIVQETGSRSNSPETASDSAVARKRAKLSGLLDKLIKSSRSPSTPNRVSPLLVSPSTASSTEITPSETRSPSPSTMERPEDTSTTSPPLTSPSTVSPSSEDQCFVSSSTALEVALPLAPPPTDPSSRAIKHSIDSLLSPSPRRDAASGDDVALVDASTTLSPDLFMHLPPIAATASPADEESTAEGAFVDAQEIH
ncbi:hypothetical protein PENTCL1PPCAC_26059, partial [Pristionchus entomophagus]